MSTTSLDDALSATGRAAPGSTVEVVDRGGTTTVYELMVRPSGPAPEPVTVDSVEGAALLGAQPGDALTIRTGNGRRRRVWVVDVTPRACGDEADPPAATVAAEPISAAQPPGSLGDTVGGPRAATDRPAEHHRRDAISVVVVDDHAAVRLGLNVAISSRHRLVCVGAVPDGELLPSLLYRVRPDVVVLDYDLPQVNGLELCRRIKADVPSPGVVLYSAYADQALTIPALVAGVDGMVHKGASALELFTTIEAVADGETLLLPPVPELAQAAAATVDPADRPLLELLLRRTPRPDIATQLNLSQAVLTVRIHAILERLTHRTQ